MVETQKNLLLYLKSDLKDLVIDQLWFRFNKSAFSLKETVLPHSVVEICFEDNVGILSLALKKILLDLSLSAGIDYSYDKEIFILDTDENLKASVEKKRKRLLEADKVLLQSFPKDTYINIFHLNTAAQYLISEATDTITIRNYRAAARKINVIYETMNHPEEGFSKEVVASILTSVDWNTCERHLQSKGKTLIPSTENHIFQDMKLIVRQAITSIISPD